MIKGRGEKQCKQVELNMHHPDYLDAVWILDGLTLL